MSYAKFQNKKQGLWGKGVCSTTLKPLSMTFKRNRILFLNTISSISNTKNSSTVLHMLNG